MSQISHSPAYHQCQTASDWKFTKQTPAFYCHTHIFHTTDSMAAPYASALIAPQSGKVTLGTKNASSCWEIDGWQKVVHILREVPGESYQLWTILIRAASKKNGHVSITLLIHPVLSQNSKLTTLSRAPKLTLGRDLNFSSAVNTQDI